MDELRSVAGAGGVTSTSQLIDTAALYGLVGRTMAIDPEELEPGWLGAILNWDLSRFVVLDAVHRDSIVVMDPARGHVHVPNADVHRLLTGDAILFERAASFQGDGEVPHRRGGYLAEILGERRVVFQVVLASILMQVLGLGLPLLSRSVIDRVIPSHDYRLLEILALGTLLLTVCQATASAIRSLLLLSLQTRLDSRLTLGFFDHLLSLPFQFFQRRSAGDLMMRVGANSSVREILTTSVLSAILDGSLSLGYLALLTLLSWQMACLTTAVVATQVALVLFTRRQQRRYLATGLDAQSKSQSYLTEVLSAVETLKGMGLEHRAVQGWSRLFSAQLDASQRRGTLDGILGAIRSSVASGSVMALTLAGALQVMSGRITLGDMMAITAVAGSVSGPALGLVSAFSGLQLLTIYLERLNEVYLTPSERRRPASGKPMPISGSIRLENVSFKYSPISACVIKGVSISVRAGECVAIVGRSGAGKSTLARLMVGLYTPTDGRVLYDERDLQTVDPASFRRQLGVVTQHAQLFAGSIRSNIALADPDVPLTDIVAAARLACIDDDIQAMPKAYDTVLMDRGTSLSGGQQQRLCLARALACRPALLLLDEATSQLDAATERAVQARLANVACTRIVVAHRLSTIVNADRILMLEDGRVVEEGEHSQLLAAGGAYAHLVSSQLSLVDSATGRPPCATIEGCGR